MLFKIFKLFDDDFLYFHATSVVLTAMLVNIYVIQSLITLWWHQMVRWGWYQVIQWGAIKWHMHQLKSWNKIKEYQPIAQAFLLWQNIILILRWVLVLVNKYLMSLRTVITLQKDHFILPLKLTYGMTSMKYCLEIEMEMGNVSRDSNPK